MTKQSGDCRRSSSREFDLFCHPYASSKLSIVVKSFTFERGYQQQLMGIRGMSMSKEPDEDDYEAEEDEWEDEEWEDGEDE